MPGTWLAALGNDHIHGFSARRLNVGPRGIEVRIVGDDVALLAHYSEENAFSGAALVGRDHMTVTKNILNRNAKPVKALASGIAFVAFHDRCPLVRGHGSGAGIGEQINENVGGRKQKKIVVRRAEKLFPLRPRSPSDRLNALDTKWLDDGAGHDLSHVDRIFRLFVSDRGGALQFVPGERLA